MGVVSFFGGLRAKRLTIATVAGAIENTEQALATVFRHIASEKNQMLYPALPRAISHAEHQAAILSAANNLIQALEELIFSAQNRHPDQFLVDLTNAIELLEKSITAYQKNDQALSQVLLACSSVKINLEKFRSDV